MVVSFFPFLGKRERERKEVYLNEKRFTPGEKRVRENERTCRS